MANRSRVQSEKSNSSSVLCLTGDAELEYFWSIELSSDKRSVSLTFNNEDSEDDDDVDYLQHTIFVKLAVLGASAVNDEQNIVVFQCTGKDGENQKGTIANLTRGLNPMTSLDFAFPGKFGGTFTLTEGSGPVCISGNHLLEYPKDDDQLDDTQAVSDNTADEEEFDEPEKDENEEGDKDDDDEKVGETKDKKAGKRKAVAKDNKRKQKARMDVDEENENEDDDDDEEEEEEEDEDEEGSSEEDLKVKKSTKAKVTGKKIEKGKTKLDREDRRDREDRESVKKIAKKMRK